MAVDIENAGILGERLQEAIKNLILPLVKSEVGLDKVDNTADLEKVVSTATRLALDNIIESIEDLASEVSQKIGQVDIDNKLNREANLADLQNIQQARSNLGLGSAATLPCAQFATSAQGLLAESAAQQHTLAPVAFSGSYNDLHARPLFGSAALQEIGYFASATQGNRADNAIPVGNRGAANGVAPLGADAKIPASFLPANGSYSGAWNAATNSPTIVSGVGAQGQFYIVSVSGSTAIDSVSSWLVGDQIRFNGTVWERIANANAVNSVSGKTGIVVLTADDVNGIASVGKTGDYNDLNNKPSFGTAAGFAATYFTNATNLVAGTVPDGRLPATMTGKTFTGPVIATSFTGSFELSSATGTLNTARLPADISVTGATTSLKVRATSTEALTVTSVNHAFQIGLSTGANLSADSSTILARNNGVATQLNINPGGNVVLGNASSKLYAYGTSSMLTAMYTGTSTNIATLPIGSIVLGTTSVLIVRNALVYVYMLAGDVGAYFMSTVTNGTVKVDGVWRMRGCLTVKSGFGENMFLAMAQRAE